jgi:CheY-like chemotaxis protein
LGQALNLARVLVADGDPAINQVLDSLGAGYRIIAVSDGAEAYRTLKRDADFKAVILEPALSGIHGLDILRYMKTEKRLMRIPVMLIAAQSESNLIADSFSAGATAFLAKPFTADQLSAALRMLLGARTPARQAA